MEINVALVTQSAASVQTPLTLVQPAKLASICQALAVLNAAHNALRVKARLTTARSLVRTAPLRVQEVAANNATLPVSTARVKRSAPPALQGTSSKLPPAVPSALNNPRLPSVKPARMGSTSMVRSVYSVLMRVPPA